MVKKIINKSKWISWKRESKKNAIGETRELTYELFKKGHSIEQIAKEREFKQSTIEYHILDLITHGIINVNDVIGKDKKLKIKDVINKENFNSLKQIYEDLNEECSYFEIKCVLSHIASKPE